MKLKLRFEDLQVETFGTTSAEDGKGTVLGQQQTLYDQPTCGGTCPETCMGGGDTCETDPTLTCGNSCESCDPSCAWDPACNTTQSPAWTCVAAYGSGCTYQGCPTGYWTCMDQGC